MDDDEEISSMVNESSVHEAEDSTMEEKLPPAEEFLNTEQCDFVPKLDDAKLVGTESPFVSKEGETVVDEEILMAGIKMEMETKTETEASMSVGLHDSQLVGAEPPIPEKDDKDDEAVEEEVITTADIKMEIRSPANVEAEEAKGEGERDSELHDSQIVGSESLIEAKDNENNETAVGEEIEAVDIKVEVELKAAVEAETAKGGGEELVPVGPESLTLGKDDGDDVMKYIPTVYVKMETGTEAEVAKGGEGESVPELDDSQLVSAVSPIMAEDGEDQALVVVEEALPVDAKMETESDVAEAMKVSSGKRRKGRNSKVPVRALAARKTIGEDVCFICFDGGDLFLCDRRGCPKGYHPSCVNRDEAFFLAKGRWNCGWHLCSKCEKNAYYMCYTCTFSLCKGCVKDAVILCVRGSKGFCETCMKTVMLIENNEQGNNEAQIDFDDKSSWEYLFKDYWIELKAKLSLSSVELAQAKNPYKGSDVLAGKQESPDDQFDVNDDGGSGPDNSSEKLVSSKSKKRKAKKRSKSLTKEQAMTSEAVAVGADGGSGSDDFSENLEASKSKQKKAKKRLKSLTKEQDITSEVVAVRAEGMSMAGNTEWGSKELLEFVMHMKDGDKTILSQFDVQAMLLEYIKRNKLRDPRRKSQIICDARLQNLFGKARVGHFEMLKLLESHFLIKEDSQIDDIQGSVVDTEVSQLDAAGNSEALTKGGKDRKRKLSKKGVWRGPQFNLDDYAAIDIHNINLIYLRRKLMEDLLEDSEKFHDNVAGTFVRIRISGSNQKQDIYRLVQVVGTSKAPKPYKIGRRTTDIMLDILNLNKTEVISIDTISNQEFTEDECKRLRQSIKCGLISRLTVGDILDKAMEIQSARVNDWLETEIVRLSHLRDRASENDRRKELRECVEKLHLLKTPEERQRRLEEIKEIHADPKMDPSYESEDDDSEMDDNKRELYARPRGSAFSRRGREAISPGREDFSPKDSWSGTRKNSGKNWELNRNLSNKNLSNKSEDATLSSEIPNDNSLNQGRDKETQHSNNLEKSGSATSSETIGWNSHSFVRSESFSGVVSEALPAASLSAPVAETASKICETEKMWRYKDPSGKVQGPFSMVQLRKWSNTGYFPVDLRIWRSTGEQVDSILLTDALAGRFPKEISPVDNGYPKASTPLSPHHASTHANKLYETSLQQGRGGQDGERLNLDQNRGAQISHGNLVPSSQSSGETLKSQQDLSSSRGWATPSVEVPKLSTVTVGSDCGSRNNSVNLPSPTPKHSIAGWTGGEVGHLMGASSVPGSNEVMQSPAAAATESGKLARSSTSSTINPSGSIELKAMGSLGVLAPTSLLDSSKQSTRVSGNDPSGFSVVPDSEQGVLAGSTNSLQSSQPTVAGESNGAQTHSHLLPAPETASNMGQSVNSQNPPFVTQGWVSAPPQNLEPNSSVHLPGQPQAYDQWGGVPSTVMNPPPNFATQGISVMPPSDPWRPPMQGNQLNMQPPVPPNTAWGTMPGNPNMVWGGPVPVNMSMNWGPIVQGPPPGNPNLGWVVPTGNVNQGWIAPPGNPPGAIVQGVAPGNANQAWVTPTGNLGANNVQGPLPGNGNPGWVQPSGNPGVNNVQGPPPGNANPGWGSPAGSRSMRGSEQNRRGERFSGQRDRGSQGGDSGFGGGRPWKRQTSFGSGGPGDSSRSLPIGQRLCEFHERGHCKKGSSCNYSHN